MTSIYTTGTSGPPTAIGSDAPWKTADQLLAEQNASTTDNESAEGKVIPLWIGTSPDIAGRPVWATAINGLGICSFAMCFGRNEFGRDFTYVTIKADDQIIYSTRGDTIANPVTMRRYNSKDNVPDPLLIADKGAALANAMMGYLVVFFENFNTAPYQNRIPIFTAQIADATASLDVDGFLTPYDGYPASFPQPLADFVNRTFLSFLVEGGIAFVSLTRLDTGTEVARAPITGMDIAVGDIDSFSAGIPLPGSNNVLTRIYNPGPPEAWYGDEAVIDGATGDILWLEGASRFEISSQAVAAPLIGGSDRLIAVVGVDTGPVVSVWNDSTREMETIFRSSSAILTIFLDVSTLIRGTYGVDGTTFYFVTNQFSNGLGYAQIYELTVNPSTATRRLVYSFDPADDTISLAFDGNAERIVALVGSAPEYRAIRISDGGVDYTVAAAAGETFDFEPYHLPLAGYAVTYSDADNWRLIDLSDGSSVVIVNSADQIFYDQTTGSYYTVESPSLDLYFYKRNGGDRTSAGTVLLADVLALLATRRGYALADIETDGLDGLSITSCYLDREIGVKALIDQICAIFGIDAYESGDKYKFVKIGRDGDYAVDMTIPDEDLIQAVGEAPSTMNGGEEFDGNVPRLVRIEYLDPAQEFKVSTQDGPRPFGIFSSATAGRVATLSAPLAMSSTLAKALAVERSYEYATGRKYYDFGLPPEYSGLEPSDVLTLPVLGESRDVKVKRVTLREDHGVAVFAQDVLIATDSSGLPADSSYVAPGPLSQNTVLYWLDGPLLRTADQSGDLTGDNLRFYGLLSGVEQENWAGGIMYLDEQDNPTSVITPIVGRATQVLDAPAVSWSTDYDNTINVKIITGDSADVLEATHTEVMNNANLAYFGKPGRWEIIQWETVTEEINGSLTLGILQRGRYGSEVFQGDHIYGDLFIPISRETLKLFHARVDNYPQPVGYRVAGLGQRKQDVPASYSERTRIPDMPLAPTDLAAVIDGSDIDITWSRRSRFTPQWLDGVWTVPLGEATESYEIDIMDGVTVVRTLAATTTAKTYLAADITTDFGSMPAELTINIYQISFKTDRGFAATATLTL